MTPERWLLLMSDDDEELTSAEWRAGWHFCPDFDGLLVGPEDWAFRDGRCICGFRAEEQR